MECKSASAAVLPEEVWVEIFKNIDVRTLLKLTQVCKHWNWLIFKYIAPSIQLNLDPDEGQIPQKGLKMAPERNYKHLHLASSTLDSLSKLMKLFKKLAPNVESLKLSLESLEYGKLIQMLELCPRLNELCIKGVQLVLDRFGLMELMMVAANIINADTSLDLENKLRVFDKTYEPCILNEVDLETSDDSRSTFPAIRSLGLDIADLEKFGRAFLPCVPNVTELEIVAHQPNLNMLERMAPQLKVLKVKVLQDAADNFSTLQLPALEVLVLRLNARLNHNQLKRFLLGCRTLKTAMLHFSGDEDVVNTVAEGLPLVERLQISGETTTYLSGLNKMTNLKELALKGCHIKNSFFCLAPTVRSVEKLDCIGAMFHYRVGDVMCIFPRLKSLSLSLRDVHDIPRDFSDDLPLLEELTIHIDHVYPYIIDQMKNMVYLKKLVIKATVFAKTNFRLLQKLIVLPAIKCLAVDVEKKPIPMAIARKVASENWACALVLNGERVEPVEVEPAEVAPVQRALRKRKAPSAIVESTSSAN